MPIYCNVAKQISRANPLPGLPYPLLFYSGRFLKFFMSPERAIALATTLFNGLTTVALKVVIDFYMEVGEQSSVKRGVFSTLMTFSLLFVSMLYPLTYIGHYFELAQNSLSSPADFPFRYHGVFSPNPYHNATYLAARGFSVFAFFLFADILLFYETEDKWYHPKYLMFSVFLMLTTLAKPSFTLILVSTAGIIMIWRLIKSRFGNVKAFFQFGIYFIPTFLVLLYQYSGMFHANEGQENGIGIGFLKAWSAATDNILLAVFLGGAFPLVVLLFQLLQRRMPAQLRLSWQFYLVALCTMLFLYEKNYRQAHLNFAWGYMYGLFFCYTVSLLVLVKNTMKHTQPLWQIGIQWGVYALHLICGLEYFSILLQGGSYS